MYYRNAQEQLSLEEFSLPFGGRLLRDNRRVRLAGLMPWEYIEEIYAQNMSEKTGRPAITSRIAFGAIFIKEYCHITDEDTPIWSKPPGIISMKAATSKPPCPFEHYLQK